MIEFLYICVILALKVMLGTIVLAGGVIATTMLGAAFIGILSIIFKPSAPREKKKPEDWKEWADKQEGDLKSLIDEIDKELENEDT